MNEDLFYRAVRDALRNLYDPAALRQNPLNALLNPLNRPLGLQEIILDAVRALGPARGSANQSDARRTHQILQHRYVEQFSQTEVATSLGLSARQLRRYEQIAIRSLGDSLRTRHVALQDIAASEGAPAGLPANAQQEMEIKEEVGIEESEPAQNSAAAPYQEDLEWLQQAAPQEMVDLDALLKAVLNTLAPLLDDLGVAVHSQASAKPARVAVKAMGFRQALMTSITALARRSRNGVLAVSTTVDAAAVHVTIQPQNSHVPAPAAIEENLLMAQQLAVLSGADLQIHQRGEADKSRASLPQSGVTFTIPLALQPALLVIDDNQDALQLVQRYLSQSLWQPIIARDPLEGLALAQRMQPRAILLDVMLPGMDGWEVLARLRRHPETEAIPVIICSILPEEQLAWSLGASGFLRKPLARDELLQTLAPLAPQSPQH